MLSNGPIMWSSKQQKITARSSAEAEIYATDECTKCIQHLRNLCDDLHLSYSSQPTPIYNDNQACIHWSYNNTSKGLRHLQIRENAVRENIQNKNITISHVEGKINIADIFTKEDKDHTHFINMRNTILHFTPMYSNYSIHNRS